MLGLVDQVPSVRPWAYLVLVQRDDNLVTVTFDASGKHLLTHLRSWALLLTRDKESKLMISCLGEW